MGFVEEARRSLCMKGPGFIIVLMMLALAADVQSQSAHSLIREGNSLYEENKFDEAEVNYRKALENDQGSVPGHFNLGGSLHKQGKFDQSVKEFETAAIRTEEKNTRAQAYYNMGNSYVETQQYDEAVKSYIESLKLSPNDQDAKHNLSYALRKLREQQQQQKNNQDQGGDKQEQQQNKENQDQGDQQQEQKNQQNRSDQNQQRMDQTQGTEQQGQQKQMSRADAERILEVLKNNEKEVQKKLRVRTGARVKTDKDW